MDRPAADPLHRGLLPPPVPDGEAGKAALQALLRERHPLAALEAIRAKTGDVFMAPLPGFKPVFLVGPRANRFVTVTSRTDLRWRPEGDPVTDLLNYGVLVTDGELHDGLRRRMTPALHKSLLGGYIDVMVRNTDRVLAEWIRNEQVDMLVEMRKAALLILMETLYGVDFAPDMPRLWAAILRNISYISPGIWVLWPGAPRPGYRWARRQMDEYLYRIIARRRAAPDNPQDLLGMLVADPEMSDALIRDQLLTMLIAGHDTSTALLAWTLYLLGSHPWAYEMVRAEVDAVCGKDEDFNLEGLGRLNYLEQVLSEALRMYPPIHLGNRRAAVDLEFDGYRLAAGMRVVYSIYLSHRHPDYWPEPGRFDPGRFTPEAIRARPPYVYVPFGGGPRNCIGMAFAQVEVKAVLARIIQRFDVELAPGQHIHPHMGATLEPRPGVVMRVRRRI